MECKIEGDEIVIRVPVAALPMALKHSEYADACRNMEIGAIAPAVTDAAEFAKAVVRALGEENDTGGTRITRMLDDAMEHACEQGAEGVDYGEEEPPEKDRDTCQFCDEKRPVVSGPTDPRPYVCLKHRDRAHEVWPQTVA